MQKHGTFIGNVTQVTDGINAVTFAHGSGRLRLLRNKRLVVQLTPPHSWTFIAVVSNNGHWGTRPTEEDLALVLQALRAKYPVRTESTTSNGVRFVLRILNALKWCLQRLPVLGA
jgi:hypothetical protein